VNSGVVVPRHGRLPQTYTQPQHHSLIMLNETLLHTLMMCVACKDIVSLHGIIVVLPRGAARDPQLYFSSSISLSQGATAMWAPGPWVEGLWAARAASSRSHTSGRLASRHKPAAYS
jgi:hypothetical protein